MPGVEMPDVEDGLLTALAAPPHHKAAFADWLGRQPALRLEALEKAALDPRWSSYALMQLLKTHGAPCSREAITKWRRELGYTE